MAWGRHLESCASLSPVKCGEALQPGVVARGERDIRARQHLALAMTSASGWPGNGPEASWVARKGEAGTPSNLCPLLGPGAEGWALVPGPGRWGGSRRPDGGERRAGGEGVPAGGPARTEGSAFLLGETVSLAGRGGEERGHGGGQGLCAVGAGGPVGPCPALLVLTGSRSSELVPVYTTTLRAGSGPGPVYR